MHELYEQWRTSGLSKSSFCKQHGILANTFHYWIKKLSQAPKAASKPESGFYQLPVCPPTLPVEPHAIAMLHFPSGIRVEVFSGIQACFLKELLS